MSRLLLNNVLIFGLFCLVGVIAYALYEKYSYEPEPESEPFTAMVSENEVLRECEYYYEHIFPNAHEYGSFDEYPVTERYTGPIAEVDLESHAIAKEFYTHHKNALAEGVNFAGKYVISDWAFTSMGAMFAVIDAETGEVFPFPYIVDWDFDFRPDSNLIIINPKESLQNFSQGSDFDCEAKWYSNMRTYYYLFEEGEFKLLGPQEKFELLPSDWLDAE